MCKFFSSILTVDDQFLYLESSDSHEDIIDAHNLRDNGKAFVRGEFSPKNLEDFCDVEKYEFTLDETVAPEWFSESVKERWVERCRALLRNRIITTGTHKLLIDKFYVLGGDAVISKAQNCVIKSAYDNCVIEYAYGNCVIESAYGNCVIKYASGNCVIKSAYGNCVIEYASGNCVIKSAYDNCVIESAYGNCVIEYASGNAKILKDGRET